MTADLKLLNISHKHKLEKHIMNPNSRSLESHDVAAGFTLEDTLGPNLQRQDH